MQFLDYDSLVEQQVTHTFKNASWRSLAWVVLIMAVITAYVAIPKGEATNPVLVAVPAFATVFFMCLLLWHVRQCMNRRNWLVKATEQGLYLNLQSNVHVPLAKDVPAVAFIPDEAIASVTRVQENRIIPSRNGQFKNTFAYFDVALHDAMPDTFLVTLAQIRRNPAIRGAVGVRKDMYAGVRVEDQHTIRLVWDWMTPRELGAEAWFKTRYALGEKRSFRAPGWSKMSPEEQDAYIDTLWEWGDVQDAVHLKSLKETISERKAALDLAARLG